MSEYYKAMLHTRGFGVELEIEVPENDRPVVVAQDVFGERETRMQMLVYPATDEAGETENAVSVRINPDGSIAEVVVPEGVNVRRWDDAEASDWMIARDGK